MRSDKGVQDTAVPTTDPSFWDGIAERYANRPLPNPDSTQRKLDVMRGLLHADHVLVDVGCGTGTIALELAQHAREVHGVDVSGEMTRIAREKARAQAADNVVFHQAGARDGLDRFDEDSVDVVSAFNILHLVHDRGELLERAFAVLRPGGTFVSSTPCLGGTIVPYRSMIAVMRWFGKAPIVDCFDRNVVVAAVRDAGFVDLDQPDVAAGKLVAFIVARKPA